MNPTARVEIDAPLALVWDVMVDTASYPDWNPFVIAARTAQPPAAGNPILLRVRWANGSETTSPERITALEPPSIQADGSAYALMSYVYEGLPSRLGLVRGTRHQRLSQAPGGPTVYDTVEEFRGPLVRLAGPGRVAEGFGRHAEALRLRSEDLASQAG